MLILRTQGEGAKVLQQCSLCGFILLIFNHTENVARVFRVVKGGVHYTPESSIIASYKVWARVPHCVCVCVYVTELWSVVCYMYVYVCICLVCESSYVRVYKVTA